jgi:hypothetical protein
MSKVTKSIEEARNLLDSSIQEMDDWDAKIQALPDDTKDEERAFHAATFERIQEDVTRQR